VAGGALAEAAVDIIADISRFTPELQARLEEAAARAAKAAKPAFDAIERRAQSIGRAIGDKVSDGARRAADALRRIPLAGRGLDAIQNAASRLAATVGPRIAEAAGAARRGLDRISSAVPGLSRISDAAVRAGRGVLTAFSGAGARAREALSRINGERFGQLVGAAGAAAARIGVAFQAAAGKARAALSHIDVSRLANGAKLAAGAFAAATAGVVGFGLKSAASLEQTRIAFTGLLGSAKEANEFIEQMIKFAARTPFEFEGLSSSARQILAFGKAAGITREQVIPTLSTIGDMAATIGAGQPEIDLVVRALGQMAGKGKTATEELQQISEAFPGFSAVAAIAQAKGISVAEAFKQIEAGSISGREGVDAVLAGMRKFPGAAGAMQRQSETLLGVFSTFKDTIADSLTRAFEPVVPAVKSTMLGLVPVIEDSLGQIAPRIGTLIARLGPLLQKLLPAVTPAVAAIFDGLAAAVSHIDAGQLQAAGDAMGSLLRAVAPLAPAITSLVGGGLSVLGPVIVALTPLIHALAVALASLAASPVGAALAPLVAQFLLVRALTGKTGLAFRSLAPPLLMVGRLIKDVFQVGPITAFGVRLVGLRGLIGKAFAGEAVGGFAAKLGKLGRFAPMLARLGPLLTNPWTAVAAVVGVAVGLIVTKVGKVREVVVQIGRNLVQAGRDFKEFLGSIGAAFKSGGLAGAAARAGSGVVNGFKTAFADLRVRIPAMARGVWGAVTSAVGGLIHGIPQIFRSAAGSLTSGMNQLAATLPAKINSVGDSIAAGLPKIADKVSAWLSAAIPKVVMFVPRLLQALVGAIRGAGGGGGGAGGGGGGGAAGGLGSAFAALITGVGGALAAQVPKLLPVLGRAALQIMMAFAQALVAATPPALAALGSVALQLGGMLARALGSLAARAGSALAALPGQLGGLLLRALLAAGPWVLQGIGFIAKQVALLPFRILGALVGLGIILGAVILRALIVAGAAVFRGGAVVVGFFRSLPGRFAAAMSALGSLLGSLASRAMARLRSAVSAAVPAVLGFFRSLPSRSVSAAAALPGQLRSLGSRALSGMRSAVSSGASAVVGFFRGLPGRIVGALSSLRGSLVSLGSAVMHGFVAGVRSAAGAIVGAVTAPIQGAINKAKSILHIGSPSKVFREIGADVGKGFVIGVTSTKSKIDSTFKNLIGDIQKAFRGRHTRTDDRLIARLKASNKRLDSLAAQRDKIVATLKAATDKAAEVTSSALDFASLTNLTNIGGPLSGQGLADQLKDRLAQLTQFRSDIDQLARAGLNKDTLAQIIGAGPGQGSQLAEALLSDRSAIAAVNATQKQIKAMATGLGQTSADVLYDAGRNAGKGFLAGLKGQQAEITKLMTSIAKQAAATVKKTLHIRSPSRLFRGLGENTLAGYLEGLRRLAPAIEAALERAVSAPSPASLPGRLAFALPGPSAPAQPAPSVTLPPPAPPAAPTVQVFLDGELLEPVAVRVVAESNRGLRRRATAKGGRR
jgi:tape measure domain-containing protein